MMPIKTSQLPTNINRGISLRFLSSSTKVRDHYRPPEQNARFAAKNARLAFRRVNSRLNVGRIDSSLPEFLIRNGKMLF